MFMDLRIFSSTVFMYTGHSKHGKCRASLLYRNHFLSADWLKGQPPLYCFSLLLWGSMQIFVMNVIRFKWMWRTSLPLITREVSFMKHLLLYVHQTAHKRKRQWCCDVFSVFSEYHRWLSWIIRSISSGGGRGYRSWLFSSSNCTDFNKNCTGFFSLSLVILHWFWEKSRSSW